MVLVAVGAVLVALVAVDVWLTVLHPTWRGPLSYAVMRAVWLLLRGAARRTGREAPLLVAAPVAMACQFAVWVAVVWLGFALIYLPSIETFAYAPSVRFGERDMLDALYVSGVSLTTVGFGDVVAATDALRLATVLEAASGLAVITAAITYLLSVYPLVSELRTAAKTVGARDARDALRLALDGGPTELAELRRALVRVDQHLKRFPILYYFHNPRPGESTLTLVHGCTLVCLHLRWGLRWDRVPFAELYGRRLQTSLEQFMEDYAERFLGSRRTTPDLAGELEDAEAARRAARLRAIVAEQAPDAVAPAADEQQAFRRFVAKADAFLAHLAERHAYPHVRLLADD